MKRDLVCLVGFLGGVATGVTLVYFIVAVMASWGQL